VSGDPPVHVHDDHGEFHRASKVTRSVLICVTCMLGCELVVDRGQLLVGWTGALLRGLSSRSSSELFVSGTSSSWPFRDRRWSGRCSWITASRYCLVRRARCSQARDPWPSSAELRRGTSRQYNIDCFAHLGQPREGDDDEVAVLVKPSCSTPRRPPSPDHLLLGSLHRRRAGSRTACARHLDDVVLRLRWPAEVRLSPNWRISASR